MKLKTLAITASLLLGGLSAPAFANPTTCADAARPASAQQLARHPGARWSPRLAPRGVRPVDLGQVHTARTTARVLRAVRHYEGAIGRADRLNLAPRRQLSDLRRDVLFLRGLLQSLGRDGRLDARDVGMLEAAMGDLAVRIEALAPRGFGEPVRVVRAR
jgi:hypothetical protein